MKACALVAAADFNARHFQEMDARGAFDAVIAVDAGYASLQAIGREPDMAIGDFDSLGYVPDACKVVEYPARKDANDLALALAAARDGGYDATFVYGALSGRLDHTMGNLQESAAASEAGLSVTLIGEDVAVRIMSGPSALDLPSCESGIVSVFAMNDCARGVSIEGLDYPLDRADVGNRTTLGLSNEFKGLPARISVEAGTLAVFLPLAALS